jgi:hypothetical protein
MPSDSLQDTPAPREAVGSADQVDDLSQANPPDPETELPVELSEFNQRLASFGLGETPDPLLTEARPPGKRRSGR